MFPKFYTRRLSDRAWIRLQGPSAAESCWAGCCPPGPALPPRPSSLCQGRGACWSAPPACPGAALADCCPARPDLGLAASETRPCPAAHLVCPHPSRTGFDTQGDARMQPRQSGRRLSDGFRFALTWPTCVPTPRSSGSPHLSSPTRQGSWAPAPRAWHCSGSRPLRVGTPATGRRSWGSLHLAPGPVCLCAQGRGGACRAGRRTNTAEHTVTGPRAASPPALCLVCSSSRVRGAGGRGGGDSEEVVGGRQKALPFAGGLEPAAKGPDLCAETSSPAP